MEEVDKSRNMRIWDEVSQTDPAYTKKVTGNVRFKFTAIDAESQLMEATRLFGPIGTGWGYEVESTEIVGDFFFAKVRIWYETKEQTFGPMVGCVQMFNIGSSKYNDGDAPKKAITTALTKLLSQLGFNADVFLGKFDDNQYVASLMREEADKQKTDKLKSAPPTKTALSGGITQEQTQKITEELKTLGMTDPTRKADLARLVSMFIGHDVQSLISLTAPEGRVTLARLAMLVETQKRDEVQPDSFRKYLWETIENGEAISPIPAKLVEAYKAWYNMPV